MMNLPSFADRSVTRPMESPLESANIQVQFLDQDDETAFVGYETHLTDSVRLVSELEFVVTAILDDESVTEIEGIIFHTEHPVIAAWQTETDWIHRYREESLSTEGLIVKVLQGLETASFQ